MLWGLLLNSIGPSPSRPKVATWLPSGPKILTE